TGITSAAVPFLLELKTLRVLHVNNTSLNTDELRADLLPRGWTLCGWVRAPQRPSITLNTLAPSRWTAVLLHDPRRGRS
ncbi:MAG: hypothetical protein KC492_22715, partial [Myxococcales bacterium]|nr:hypothetical protein [Myxococcales bacterium]